MAHPPTDLFMDTLLPALELAAGRLTRHFPEIGVTLRVDDLCPGAQSLALFVKPEGASAAETGARLVMDIRLVELSDTAWALTSSVQWQLGRDMVIEHLGDTLTCDRQDSSAFTAFRDEDLPALMGVMRRAVHRRTPPRHARLGNRRRMRQPWRMA